jgi:hypothetical protein
MKGLNVTGGVEKGSDEKEHGVEVDDSVKDHNEGETNMSKVSSIDAAMSEERKQDTKIHYEILSEEVKNCEECDRLNTGEVKGEKVTGEAKAGEPIVNQHGDESQNVENELIGAVLSAFHSHVTSESAESEKRM